MSKSDTVIRTEGMEALLEKLGEANASYLKTDSAK